MKKRFNPSVEQTKDISQCTQEFVDKLLEVAKRLENFASQADEMQIESIADFKKAYEEQSRSDSEKLIVDMTSLVANHIRRQTDLVDARLIHLRESGIANKSFLGGHVSSVGDIVTHAKMKWQAFCMQVEKDAKDTADYFAAKHCRMEALLQHSVGAAELAFKHTKKTHEAVNQMGTKHVSAEVSLIRNASDRNVQHDMEIHSAQGSAEEDMAENSEDILLQFDDIYVQERETIIDVLNVVDTHTTTLETFREHRCGQCASIEGKTSQTFHKQYKDYETRGSTPIR